MPAALRKLNALVADQGSPKAALLVLARRVGRRLSWGVADQGLSSVTNFVIAVYVARTLGAVSFGAFSIAFLSYTFALNASRGLATDPLLTRYSATDAASWRRATADCTGTAVAVGLVSAACSLGVGLLLGGPTGAAFLALAITVPGLLVQDSWRYAFFAIGRGSQALINDGICAVALVPALLAVSVHGHPTVFWCVMAWGGVATLGALIAPLQGHVVPRLSRCMRWLAETRDLGLRYLLEGTCNSAANQLRTYGIGLMLGLAAVGYVQGARTLMGPFTVVFFGMGLVAQPEATRALRHSTRHVAAFCGGLGIALGLLAGLWGLILLIAMPRGLGHFLLGSFWQQTYPLVLPMTLSMVAAGFVAGALAGLHSVGAAKRSLRAMAVGSVLAVALSLGGAVLDGTLGSVNGLALAGWLGAGIYWWELRAGLRDHAAAHDEIPGPEIVSTSVEGAAVADTSAVLT
jgi:O-antigen/teichoic acid export membrane protein